MQTSVPQSTDMMHSHVALPLFGSLLQYPKSWTPSKALYSKRLDEGPSADATLPASRRRVVTECELSLESPAQGFRVLGFRVGV